MGSIWIRELKGGLDTRKMPETTPGGALIKAQDGHPNRGGEFEQRAAFVSTYALPAGATVGLAAGKTGLFAFGHAAAPTMPSGVTYQRLQHPIDNTIALTRILSVDLNAGKLYVVGEFADGSRQHYYDGTVVSDWRDGRARASFTVTGGTSASSLTMLTVNSVNVLGGAVAWRTSNAATAAAIAAEINSHNSIPEYVATAVDNKVNILAADVGTGPNGYALAFTLASGFVVQPITPIVLAGGLAASTKFMPGKFVKTIGSKAYVTSDGNLHFSGVRLPAGWDTTNVSNIGAGAIDMSSETAGAEQLVALGKYLSFVAVFAPRVTLVWFLDPDPALNKLQQVLGNTGTSSPRTVVQFGDVDLFYLDESGLRSMRARANSTSASTSDIGIAIDKLVIAKLQALSADDLDKVIGLIEPRDGRFWLIFPDEIFVLSYFSGSDISAWSTYLPTAEVAGVQTAFTISDAVVFRRKVYLRAGDTVYSYGGLGAAPTYDNVSPELWLPYLDGDTPTKLKTLTGIDVACEGLWRYSMALQPNELATEDDLGRVWKTTYNGPRLPAEGQSTHFSLRFRGEGTGFKKIGSAVIHFMSDDDKKEE
jgi:hypothetical protein